MTSTELTKGVIELKAQQSRIVGHGIIKTPRYVDNEAKVIPAKVIMGLWLGFILLLGPSISYAQVMYGGGSIPGARPYSLTFTGSGTFSVPTGVKTIFLTGCGAGGGGGGGHTADPGGGGGGGGGGVCAVNMPVTVVPGSSLTITIGSGGTGGAAGASSGAATNTTIAGLPIGTYTLYSSATASPGTVTNGGAGGPLGNGVGGGGATGTGAGASGSVVASRQAGGDITNTIGGGAGGGATGPGAGGITVNTSGYNGTSISGGAANGSKGGGGAGASSPFGMGAVGGSNAAGTSCTVGYGGGGGGGAATFAGGNGCPGFLIIAWWN